MANTLNTALLTPPTLLTFLTFLTFLGASLAPPHATWQLLGVPGRLAGIGTAVAGGAESAPGPRTAYTELRIEGLTSPESATRVEKALAQVPGVVEAEVSLEAGRAFIQLDVRVLPSQEQLIAAVQQAGFKASSTVGREYVSGEEKAATDSSAAVAGAARSLLASGRWEGPIATDGGPFRVMVDVARLDDGRWIAEVDLPSQEVEDYPIAVEVDGRTVRLRLVSRADGSDDAVFEGTISEDGRTFSGSFEQHAKRAPFTLTRAGEPRLAPERLGAETSVDSLPEVLPLSSDARELKQRFNADADKARLVLLLSPT